MSSGQRPRQHAHFPRMKRRGQHRKRRPRITAYDHQWKPIWPPIIAGIDLRKTSVTIENQHGARTLGPDGYWHEDRS